MSPSECLNGVARQGYFDFTIVVGSTAFIAAASLTITHPGFECHRLIRGGLPVTLQVMQVHLLIF